MGSLRKNVAEVGHADQQRYELAMQAVQSEGVGLNVLELGCDDGTFAYGFAKIGCSVTSVDLDCQNAIKIHPHENINYLEMNVEDIQFEREFDVVHAGEILEHVVNPAKLMRVICQAVKESGLLMISVPNFAHPSHLRTYTKPNFERLLRKYNVKGTVFVVRHKLERKKNSDTERYVIYDGRLTSPSNFVNKVKNKIFGCKPTI